MGKGNYFGEMALLSEMTDKRSATVSCVTAVSCYTLDREPFRKLIGNVAEKVQTFFGNFKLILKSRTGIILLLEKCRSIVFNTKLLRNHFNLPKKIFLENFSKMLKSFILLGIRSTLSMNLKSSN